MLPNPPRNPNYVLGPLKYRGRVVIDLQGKEITDFRNLPLTIASNVQGFRIEAWMRQDHRIAYSDIAARMRTEVDANRNRKLIYGVKPLAARAMTFRDQAGCVAWKDIQKRPAASKSYMDSLRTPMQRRLNQCTNQDLTKEQRKNLWLVSRSLPLPRVTAPTPAAPLGQNP